MRKNQLLATALGVALIAGPALAQQAGMPMQNDAMPMPAPYQPGMGQSGAAGGGMMSGQADDMGRSAATRMVEQASAALSRGRTAEANNLLEQAETRLLTRSTPATMAGQPMRDPALDRLSAARGALQSRDRAGAMREMDQAMASLRGDTATGAGGMGMPPAQGGGAGWGSGASMRDNGPAGRSMSRADAIIRVQAGGSGSGGLSGSTPGSPGVGNQGSTPGAGMGTTTQPGGTSGTGSDAAGGRALPGSSAGGVGTPAPGTTAPQTTGTGRSQSGGTVRQGTQGGGTPSR
jgi:hypothetical protein